MLKTKHDDLIKGDHNEEDKMKILDEMGRILTVNFCSCQYWAWWNDFQKSFFFRWYCVKKWK